jgi:Spy/CpxP family protein refolding chaperone
MSDIDRGLAGLRWSAVALLLAIFAAGAFSGAGMYRWASHAQEPRHPHPERGPGMIHRELGLSADQEKRVEAIMQKYRPELEAVIRETFPRVKAVHEKMDAEIRTILTDEQRQKFDEMQSRRPQEPRPGMDVPGGPGMDGPPPGGPPPFMPPQLRFGPPGDSPLPGSSTPEPNPRALTSAGAPGQ